MQQLTIADAHSFALALFRISGFMFIAPVFGSNAIPARLKIVISILLAFIMRAQVNQVEIPQTAFAYMVFVSNELAIGLLTGFIFMLFFNFIQVAGQLIDHELGLSLANVIDPITQEQTSVIGQFKLLVTTIIFLLLDGHLALLSTFMSTFKVIPVGDLVFPSGLYKFASMELITQLLKLSIIISAPVVVASIVTTVSLGFMTRAFPEFNFFASGFNLRILIILVVVLLAIPVILNSISNGLVDMISIHRKSVENWR